MKQFFPVITFLAIMLGIGAKAEDLMTVYGDSGTKPGRCVLRARGHAQGTDHVYSGDALNGMYARGYNGSAFTTANGASIEIQASEDWTTTANGTKFVFYTTPKQSTTAAAVLTVNGAGLQLLTNAAPRTNLTPSAAGTLVWNSADGQLCVSTGTVATSWVQVADGTTACSH